MQNCGGTALLRAAKVAEGFNASGPLVFKLKISVIVEMRFIIPCVLILRIAPNSFENTQNSIGIQPNKLTCEAQRIPCAIPLRTSLPVFAVDLDVFHVISSCARFPLKLMIAFRESLVLFRIIAVVRTSLIECRNIEFEIISFVHGSFPLFHKLAEQQNDRKHAQKARRKAAELNAESMQKGAQKGEEKPGF